MSATRKRRVEDLQPTGQYKAALYGLKCGDREPAEYYARNQPRRSRSAKEFLDVINRLNLLNEEGLKFFGLGGPTQLSFDQDTVVKLREGNGHGNGHQKQDRLSIAKERLAGAGQNGLKIWTLVTAIGQEEGVADPRDTNWRRPVAAELNEYADQGELYCIGDRFWLNKYAPAD